MISARYQRWVRRINTEAEWKAGSAQVWIPFELCGVGFFTLITQVPILDRYFGLDLGPAVLAFQAAVLPVLTSAAIGRRGPPAAGAIGLLVLANATAIKFVAAALLLQASPAAAQLFSGLFALLAGFYGYLLRASPKEPFVTLGTLLSVGTASLSYWPDESHWPPLVFALAVGLIAEGFFGSVALREDAVAARAKGVQAALEAQMLAERNKQFADLQTRLIDALGTHHDIANALTASMMDAEMVGLLVKTEPLGPAEVTTLRAVVVDLMANLKATQGTVAQLREQQPDGDSSSNGSGPDRRAPLTEMALAPAIDQVLFALRRRHAHVEISVRGVDLEHLHVRVRGVDTLHRIVSNLVLNACQGDGVRSATHVVVSALRDDSGSGVRFVVEDDGPGFPADQLAGSIRGFHTTKPEGVGLGLYTVERLVCASGGTLKRANRPEGGASVTVLLLAEA